jgi:hypothetical protein
VFLRFCTLSVYREPIHINLGPNRNYWNQGLIRTGIGTRWRESWNITNEITVNENVCLIQYKLMYRDKIHTFYSMKAESRLKYKTNNDLSIKLTMIHKTNNDNAIKY